MKKLSFDQDRLLVNGKPVRILSGAIHYFRTFPGQWRDRLEKLAACGLNTVETYVPWNMHEPAKGNFNFSGIADLEAFIRLAASMDLMVIVRPGPYICAEWEFGGLPAWLLNQPGLRIRCSNPQYMRHVSDYFDELLPRIAKLQATQDGPVIAVQIENEYGSYGQDKTYLEALRALYIRHGISVPHFTSDGPSDLMLQGGTLPDVWKTANFGSKANEAFDKLKDYENGPLMCMEFWNGWFDHWNKPHHTRDAADAAATLDEILTRGAHVNFYMFHGGTNFGFMNGANCQSPSLYEPTVNSYDYDAPLSEAGDPTPKYHAFREIIRKHFPETALKDVPPPSPKAAYGKVLLNKKTSLFSQLPLISHRQSSPTPECMEHFGQAYGFIHYRTRLNGALSDVNLSIQNANDRAIAFLDQHEIGVFNRNTPLETVNINIPPQGAQLDILVENMGRVNYGSLMHLERKGITDGVRLGGQFQFGWEIHPLPLDNIENIDFTVQDGNQSAPLFIAGEFMVEGAADTFLYVPDGHKGVCWINGFNLGRYWNAGPQRSLYVPAPLLRKGMNSIVVLELHNSGLQSVEFLDRPKLG